MAQSGPYATIPRAVLLSPEWRALTLAQRDVLLLLDSYADGATGLCWPSQARLASELGVSQRTITRAIGRLEELGFARRTAYAPDPRRLAYKVGPPLSLQADSGVHSLTGRSYVQSEWT